jgi:hypothetical protein
LAFEAGFQARAQSLPRLITDGLPKMLRQAL